MPKRTNEEHLLVLMNQFIHLMDRATARFSPFRSRKLAFEGAISLVAAITTISEMEDDSDKVMLRVHHADYDLYTVEEIVEEVQRLNGDIRSAARNDYLEAEHSAGGIERLTELPVPRRFDEAFQQRFALAIEAFQSRVHGGGKFYRERAARFSMDVAGGSEVGLAEKSVCATAREIKKLGLDFATYLPLTAGYYRYTPARVLAASFNLNRAVERRVNKLQPLGMINDITASEYKAMVVKIEALNQDLAEQGAQEKLMKKLGSATVSLSKHRAQFERLELACRNENCGIRIRIKRNDFLVYLQQRYRDFSGCEALDQFRAKFNELEEAINAKTAEVQGWLSQVGEKQGRREALLKQRQQFFADYGKPGEPLRSPSADEEVRRSASSMSLGSSSGEG